MTTNSQENKLIDKFGRRVDYVRLSVTDRCDFRCVYCMTEGMTFLPRDQVLSLEELFQVAQAFTELGVKKIRLTGGEPMVRTDVMSLIEQMGTLPGLEELLLTWTLLWLFLSLAAMLPLLSQHTAQACLHIIIARDQGQPRRQPHSDVTDQHRRDPVGAGIANDEKTQREHLDGGFPLGKPGNRHPHVKVGKEFAQTRD